MNRIPRAHVVRPSERLQTRGLSREPVGVTLKMPGSVPAIVEPERGYSIPVTATAVSTELLPVDVSRKFLFIQNNDPVGVAFVSFGGAAAFLNQGFRLAPGGGGILLDNNVPTARAFIIGTIANNPNLTMVVG